MCGMCPDDGQHAFRALIVAVKEVPRNLQQRRQGSEKFAMSHFTAQVRHTILTGVSQGLDIGKHSKTERPAAARTTASTASSG